MAFHDGMRAGRYELLRRIGSGGMGEVWEARDEQLGRTVALKLVSGEDGPFNERFLREARLAARLEHPHVLPVHDFGRTADAAFLVMPVLTGGDLKVRMESSQVSSRTAIGWLRDTASALDYAHAKGVFHRDVKPANLLFDAAGKIYLADFGLAKSTDPSRELTSAGTAMGTPGYMSPEQLRGDPIDARTDQFSLAAIAYRLLTGHPAFQGDSVYTVLTKTLEAAPPAPSSLNPRLPREVDGILLRGLARNPTDRFPTCLALVEALESLRDQAASRPQTSTDGPTASPTGPSWAAENEEVFSLATEGRRSGAAPILIGVLVLLAGTIAFFARDRLPGWAREDAVSKKPSTSAGPRTATRPREPTPRPGRQRGSDATLKPAPRRVSAGLQAPPSSQTGFKSFRIYRLTGPAFPNPVYRVQLDFHTLPETPISGPGVVEEAIVLGPQRVALVDPGLGVSVAYLAEAGLTGPSSFKLPAEAVRFAPQVGSEVRLRVRIGEDVYDGTALVRELVVPTSGQ